MKKQGNTSYHCRFIMTLNEKLDDSTLQQAIQQSAYFQLLERTKLFFPKLGIPRWQIAQKRTGTNVYVHHSNSDDITEVVLNKSIELKSDRLYHFDLIQHPKHSTLVFSWHHILMDGYGANALLYSLSNPVKDAQLNFLPASPKESLRQQWNKLMKTKDFLKDISKGSLLKIKEITNNQKVEFVELKLDISQTEKTKLAVKKYSRGGIDTPYFLGVIAMAYFKILEKRGTEFQDIFVPVPMELRKAKAIGPIVSNQHTLLFFRIKSKLRTNKALLIKDLNAQFFDQIKTRMPHNYASMINLLRILPTSWYYKLVKGPNDESLAGFLYSQSPSPNNLSQLLGCQVVDALALPPNTSPPGISFQMMTFGGQLKLIIQFSQSCFQREEITSIAHQIQKELIAPDDQ